MLFKTRNTGYLSGSGGVLAIALVANVVAFCALYSIVISGKKADQIFTTGSESSRVQCLPTVRFSCVKPTTAVLVLQMLMMSKEGRQQEQEIRPMVSADRPKGRGCMAIRVAGTVAAV